MQYELPNAILALGDRLVEELSLQVSGNTLGRWMAHHVAELLEDARGSAPEAKGEKVEACRRAILELWDHLHVLSSGSRPFEKLEVVTRAIQSLDPDNRIPRYFGSVLLDAPQGKVGSDSEKWLELATRLDEAAKILIGFFLGEAAKDAVDDADEWVQLAQAAGMADDGTGVVIRFVSDSADVGKVPDADGIAKRKLEDRIERLESFTRLAGALAQDLRGRLATLPEAATTGAEDQDEDRRS